MDKRMSTLEEAVACETWTTPIPYPSSQHQQQATVHPTQQQQQRSSSVQSRSLVYSTSHNNDHVTSNVSDPDNEIIVDAIAVPIIDDDNQITPIRINDYNLHHV
jgi:hypothetical protein